ncbi:hypothetical protein ACGYKB_15905 [Sulfitobacter sp. 916]|uniref:hypothetical protein n=1 Tax=Sulfitobacter sp. 916 TaxID=3368559 RepID=UPI003745F25D
MDIDLRLVLAPQPKPDFALGPVKTAGGERLLYGLQLQHRDEVINGRNGEGFLMRVAA